MRQVSQAAKFAKIKKGAGTFVYLGGSYDTESVPGVPLIGKDGHQVKTVPLVTVQDAQGNPITVADPKSGGKGQPVWVRAPKFTRTERQVYRLRLPGVEASQGADGGGMVADPDLDGVVPQLYLEFKKLVPQFVADPVVALKLRTVGCFREIVDEAAADAAAIAESVQEKPIDEMSKAELIEYATSKGIEFPDRSSKSEIIELIEAKQAEQQTASD